MRIVSYCLMPNHWHLVLWPRADGELSEFMRLLTVTHTLRWHAHFHSAGTGPLHQGRFKSFPIEQDHHLLTVCRYVERNALRAKLVKSAEAWQWCNLAARRDRRAAEREFILPPVKWPVSPPRNWLQCVNRADDDESLETIRESVRRGRPFGEPAWKRRIAARLGLTATMNAIGRPRMRPEPASPTRRSSSS